MSATALVPVTMVKTALSVSPISFWDQFAYPLINVYIERNAKNAKRKLLFPFTLKKRERKKNSLVKETHLQ